MRLKKTVHLKRQHDDVKSKYATRTNNGDDKLDEGPVTTAADRCAIIMLIHS